MTLNYENAESGEVVTGLENLLDGKLPPEAARAVGEAGGRLALVGGRLRDHLLSTPSAPASAGKTDEYDLVAFGLELETLAGLFGHFGPVRLVGRRGALADEKEPALVHLRLGRNLLEISPARRLGGRRAVFSKEAGPLEDALCRDFTVNALYYDPLTRSLEDPLGGLEDLAARRLRPCHQLALELDPLRLMRAVSLISRLGFSPGRELSAAARRCAGLLSAVPRDRLWPEWHKWAGGRWPHLGLDFMEKSGLLAFWPSLAALAATPQNPRFHPEGDVWRHTVLVVRAMSELELPASARRPLLLLAALLHDLGKPLVTVFEGGRLISKGHAQAGLKPAREFLEGLRAPLHWRKPILKLVERHMDLAFRAITPKALRRLARRLAPEVALTEYWALAAADWNGRGPGLGGFPLTLAEFLEPLGGADQAPPPLLMGRDILAAFPVSPGPALGNLLRRVEEAADEGLLKSREEALAYVGRLIDNGLGS
ncbi:MAG: HD domain-containing protein [Candidatus Adiutrix sp.]|jgi:tRNA nucleotidyltransferase (CCA-adding enzyme)|nr:HD domain-containing protein [Candidatus Adiutrix sp.]